MFFRGDAPSALARRRLTRLTAGVGHVLGEAKKSKAKIRDGACWIGELEEVYVKLEALEKQQRASRAAQVEMGPEVAAQRLLWLATYGANKLLIRGLLAHYGKPELLPLIFDDLAEVHRISGVSDAEPPPDETATPSPANLPVSSIASGKRSARLAIALERQKLTAPGFGDSACSTNRVIRASLVRPRSKRSSRTSPTGNTSALPRRIKLSRRCSSSTFKCSGSRSLG